MKLKKRQKLSYRVGSTVYDLRYVRRERWGDSHIIGHGKVVYMPYYVYLCKVLTKGWYREIYLTQNDFDNGLVTEG